jgi:pimeloyl-ACP methyl ester carboxylesterase
VRTEERAPGVIAYGWSLGGGAAVAAAGMDDERLIDGVITEAPYRVPWTPAFRVMRAAALPWRVNGPIAMALLGVRLGMGPMWRRRGGFDRAVWAAKVRVPVTVIHGNSDAICPIEDGRDIGAGAGPRGRIVEISGGGHNDLWTDARWSTEVGRAVAETIRATPIGPEMGIPPARG